MTAPHLEVEVFAAIEVAAGRLAAFPMVGAPQLVADNVVGARMIVGPTLGLDAAGIRSLDTIPVTLWIDGEEVADGTGADALGHPLAVLACLGASHVGQVGDADVGLRVVSPIDGNRSSTVATAPP